MESLANVREHELEEFGQPFRDGPFETSVNLTSRQQLTIETHDRSHELIVDW